MIYKPLSTVILIYCRVIPFNHHNVQQLFDKLRLEFSRQCFASDSIYNLDDTGAITVYKPQKIIPREGRKQIVKTTSAERGVFITVYCAINTLGDSVPRFLIFASYESVRVYSATIFKIIFTIS